MFVLLLQVSLATVEPTHWLNVVNNLPSRPAIKTINSCIDKPLYKQEYFTYLFQHWNTAFSITFDFPTELEKFMLDFVLY